MRWIVLVSLLCCAACDQPEKPKGTGTFDDLRAYLTTQVHPEAAAWQAAEVRIEALGAAEARGRQAEVVEETAVLLRRWADLLEGAPTPLPIRAPNATLKKALRALADARGAARGKELKAVDTALADLVHRKVQAVPDPREPLKDVPYLVRMWRDLTSLRDAGPAPKEGATDALADLQAAAQQAVAVASSPAERLAHGLAVQLLYLPADLTHNTLIAGALLALFVSQLLPVPAATGTASQMRPNPTQD